MQLVTFERRLADDEDGNGAAPHSMGDLASGFDALEPSTGTRRLGALVSRGPEAASVVDLNRALALKLAAEDVGAPGAEADSLLPSDALSFLRDGARALDAARSALDFAVDALDRYDAPDVRRAGVVEPRGSVRLCAPVPRPGKIVGVARNYRAHAAERGGAAPEEPVLFLKAPSSVIGPEDEILLPAASRQVDFEGELAVVIGQRGKEVPAERALEYVAGYCIANDVTARDFQNERGQHSIGKSCDTFAPLGPVLVTGDEVPDPQDLALRTTVSGELMQTARTKEMVFPVAEILAFASRLMTLEPGDVLLTGTPGGVGAARTPPRFLRDGDVVEVAVERLGCLRSYVRSGLQAGR
ncbi:MAG: fumarylacetoacetate hydrolase family protein [Myxococcota bacterium]|nr:fumarylacetoacetate hydrolase family protein [Myxococcota bacterium]